MNFLNNLYNIVRFTQRNCSRVALSRIYEIDILVVLLATLNLIVLVLSDLSGSSVHLWKYSSRF